jgi:hypothetical protein
MDQTDERGRSERVGVGQVTRGRCTSWLMKAVAMAMFSVLLGPALAVGETASKPVNTAAPKLTGTPAVGQALSCSQGSWANNPTGYAYAWLRDGSPIAGQTASSYTVQSADQGHSISCQVTATNAGGEYTIAGLSSGSYKVSFSGFACGENECTPLNYLTQFFNGKSSSKEGDSVAVAAGSTTSSINAEMHPGGQISGRVTDASTHAALANIQVCANAASGGGFEFGGCATTNSAGGSASATSNAVAVPAPNSNFSLAKAPVFDAKTGDLDFFFQVTNAGTFSWQLFFKNADVGFADALGLGLGESEVAAGDGPTRVDLAAAVTAKKKGKQKGKRCKPGFTKHKGKCVRVLVSFASGSQSVPAGTVEIKVHASAKAIKALNAGHALHVSGPFTFLSALGGPAVTHTESVVVHGHRKHGKKHGKHKGH